MTHPMHSDACKCECDQLAERIRTLHSKRKTDGEWFCMPCTQLVQEFEVNAWVCYPCETIIALKGGDDWNKISEVVRYLDDL